MQEFPKPQYIGWIIKENGIVFEDKVPLLSYRIDYDETKDDVIDEWADHIRKHYIRDEALEESISSLHLTKKEYLSFKMYYCEDLSIKEISNKLNSSTANIKYYLYSARKKVKERYDE